ncbi:hypothetical protein DFA_04452 [Cavenderia fasciculata]|uniref:Uncharacterized protein n=1 Tax=Cavenderia fasciculata TaxID=261658 RepID=F4PPM1_CACFS|nr:uncharacterized protein DFA_04452 [Cavenderia fasciculata]EGG22334.1 hypothetical protein DFA_04452 [Cavenderia fasciculata]|eukprot:XP_004360185.1 hypothetical protein DFA_04452 [Cavenderia fasciculata]
MEDESLDSYVQAHNSTLPKDENSNSNSSNEINNNHSTTYTSSYTSSSSTSTTSTYMGIKSRQEKMIETLETKVELSDDEDDDEKQQQTKESTLTKHFSSDEEVLKFNIQDLTNFIKKLEQSNKDLEEAYLEDPDPIYSQSISENVTIIQRKLKQLEELEQLLLEKEESSTSSIVNLKEYFCKVVILAFIAVASASSCASRGCPTNQACYGAAGAAPSCYTYGNCGIVPCGQGKSCLVVNGQATCVTPTVCPTCASGTACYFFPGTYGPACFSTNVNCGIVPCAAGQTCVANPFGGASCVVAL